MRKRKARKEMIQARRLMRQRSRTRFGIDLRVAAIQASLYLLLPQNSRWISYAVVSQNGRKNWYNARGISRWRGTSMLMSGGALFMIADSHAKGRCAFLHTDISLRAESIMHHATTKRMTFVCVYRFDNCIVFDCIFIHSSACCHLLSPQGFCAQLTTPSTLPLLAYDVHPSSSEGCAFRELRLKR